MTAAIVELDSLSDSVWTASQNDNLLLRRGRRLIFFFVSRVEVGRVAFKLRGAGVYKFEHRLQTILGAQMSNLLSSPLAVAHLPQICKPRIRDAHALGFTHDLRRYGIGRMLLDLLLHIGDFFQLVKEPGIDSGDARKFLDGVALA